MGYEGDDDKIIVGIIGIVSKSRKIELGNHRLEEGSRSSSVDLNHKNNGKLSNTQQTLTPIPKKDEKELETLTQTAKSKDLKRKCVIEKYSKFIWK